MARPMPEVAPVTSAFWFSSALVDMSTKLLVPDQFGINSEYTARSGRDGAADARRRAGDECPLSVQFLCHGTDGSHSPWSGRENRVNQLVNTGVRQPKYSRTNRGSR